MRAVRARSAGDGPGRPALAVNGIGVGVVATATAAAGGAAPAGGAPRSEPPRTMSSTHTATARSAENAAAGLTNRTIRSLIVDP